MVIEKTIQQSPSGSYSIGWDLLKKRIKEYSIKKGIEVAKIEKSEEFQNDVKGDKEDLVEDKIDEVEEVKPIVPPKKTSTGRQPRRLADHDFFTFSEVRWTSLSTPTSR